MAPSTPGSAQRKQPVTIGKFYTDHAGQLGLRLVAGAEGLNRPIQEPTVNRPGLVLAGFTKYYAFRRIQVIGNAEFCFLKSIEAEERVKRYHHLLKVRIPGIIFSRNLSPDRLLLKAADRYHVPIFRSPQITMKLINLATMAMETMFAPSGSEYGSMVDILGVGVIVRGESGIGKSECVLALIERGYSLVSDDITRVTLLDGRDIIGTSPEITKHFMEVRGIGLINVAEMFGVRAIRHEQRVDLVVTLKLWDHVPDVDRVGMEDQHVKILGTEVPHIVIPVRPGRDIARLVEVAALQTKLKQSGRNSAREFNERLIAKMTGKQSL